MGEGLNRRELLKRGAIAGGALWASPIMHSVGMAQASAEDTSGCRVKLTVSDQTCAGSDAVHVFEVCVTGCKCTIGGAVGDAVELLFDGVSAGIVIPLGPDGCGSIPLRLGFTFTAKVQAVCLDAGGAVQAASNEVTVTWDGTLC